jgi:hypothetical protein
MAYALYRQLPELVPGSYRLLANLLSASKEAQTSSNLIHANATNGNGSY